ncbi:uncharacterized protein LOC127417450 isoform X2 [Myxocyprinus asiaticus]|uniref:uncharacterized protein LOC127417450 isoform X2 n=1 Tax=Myxocyprinus asiaticus TaxID=70543 RepID=UPI002222DB08|nr:uncharacterized protein LOC127417450 isoform X2 [Myxocyprinus asiaticus]
MPHYLLAIQSNMNTVYFLIFVCCIGAENIGQPTSLQTSKLGDNVTIECYLPDKDFNNMVWYKQKLMKTPHPISRCYNYLRQATFFDGYNDGRFNVTIDKGIFHLHISMSKNEDIATYFCGLVTLGELKFGPGTFLMLQGEHTSTTVLQELISDEVHLGDKVTFVCRVKTVHGKCSGGYNAFWIRKGSDEYHPSIIYTDEDIEKRCEESSDNGSTTKSCIYNLIKTNLSITDAGTYYCAVSACNKIMFGNGTTLEFNPQPDSCFVADSSFTAALLNPVFLTLVSSNIISLIIMISLVAVQCKHQNISSVCVNRSDQDTSEGTQVGDTEALTYTSVSFTNKPWPSRGAEQQDISKHNELYSKIKS